MGACLSVREYGVSFDRVRVWTILGVLHINITLKGKP